MIKATDNWEAILSDSPLWKHSHYDHYCATFDADTNVYTVTYEFPNAPVRVVGDAATLRDADDLVCDDWAVQGKQAARERELDRRGYL